MKPPKDKISLVLMGRSGSGKGTQAKFLIKYLKKSGIAYIETGELLRTIAEKNNSTSIHIRKILLEGKLIPSWLGEFVWMRELIDKRAIEKNLIFDGSPRTLVEAQLLDEVSKWHGRELPLCIFLDVDSPIATNRLLKRGRKDDSIEAIKNRMKFFSKEVIKVLDYYKRNGRMIRVDGSFGIIETKNNVFRALSNRLKKRWQIYENHN